MGLSLVPGGAPVYPNLAAFAARAAEAVADPADGVAADPSVLDTESGTLYGDGVEHAPIVTGLREGHKSCSTSPTPLAEPVWVAVDSRWGKVESGWSEVGSDWSKKVRRERERQAFLRRVQHVDPRERRP